MRRRGWGKGWRRVKVWHEEGQRREHGVHAVLWTPRADAERRGWPMVGGQRPSFHVLLLFIPHRCPRSATGPSLSARASSDHAYALHRLDPLPGERAVGVAQGLDGGSFGAGRHQRLDAVVLAVLARCLFTPLLRLLPLPPLAAGLTTCKRPLLSHPAAVPDHPQQVVLPVFPPFHVAAGGRGDMLLGVFQPVIS